MRIRRDKGVSEELQGIDAELIATVSDALAHPVRLALFRYIMHCNQERQTVCTKDLVQTFDYAQATISQHMNKLVKSGLVEVRKEHRFAYFYANLGILSKYINATKKFSIM